MNGSPGETEFGGTGRAGAPASPKTTESPDREGCGAGVSRVERARRVLDAAGIHAPVRAVGVDGEIAAVTGSPELKAPLARVAPELRAVGFRYVALELNSERKRATQDT